MPRHVIGDAWHCIAFGAKTRVYCDSNHRPIAVATLAKALDSAEREASNWWGKPLAFDTWFCIDDSPHAALLSPGAFTWPGDWMIAGVETTDKR